jgi:lipopolysaccharide biosynthesis glycosyltransferase
MLDSVLANSGGLAVHVHYVHGPDLGDAATRLRDMVAAAGARISFYEVADERLEGLPTMVYEGVPASLWYRTFLDELAPDAERVLYLDGDAIAVDSLAPLWETDLGDDHLGAVTNVLMREHAGRPERLGLPGPESYFNTGVMLLNLGAWRREGLGEAIRDYARANRDDLGWADQDAMNIVVGERRTHLHPRWNVMNSVVGFNWADEVFGAEAIAEARANPGIRHFEGPGDNKPWHYLCERELRELYLEHRRRTPWPEVELEGATLRNRLRRRLRS